MARYGATVESARSQVEVFDDIADFTTVADWDPNVSEAERLDEGPLAVGSRFAVVTDFVGRELRLVYEVVEYERPERIVLRAATTRFTSTDTITVAGDGTLTYEAVIAMEGLGRLVDPIVGLAFRLVGGKAADGLRQRLARPAAA